MALADQVAKVVVVGAISACSAGVAWVAAKRHSNKTIADLHGQIEELNQSIESVLTTFEIEAGKAIDIMVAIAERNPKTGAEMLKLLSEHKLSVNQKAKVMAKLNKQGFFGAVA